MRELILRSWRVTEAQPHGLTVWFDPHREQLKLYELEPPDYSGVREGCEGDDQETDPGAPKQHEQICLDLETGLPF